MNTETRLFPTKSSSSLLKPTDDSRYRRAHAELCSPSVSTCPRPCRGLAYVAAGVTDRGVLLEVAMIALMWTRQMDSCVLVA